MTAALDIEQPAALLAYLRSGLSAPTKPMTAALDIEQPAALLAYLRSTGRIGAGETPSIRTLTGGVSSRTVLVERPTGEAWVLKQSLPKLRVETDWFSDPARIHREALGLRWLKQ